MKNTVRVMSGLRELNARIRKNNLRINEWVDDYLNWCVLNGEPINILTQWCISKDLEERFNRQGGRFLPTRKERRLFQEEIPRVIKLFTENDVRLNWWITFNRSYLDSGRISGSLEEEYKRMIEVLADSSGATRDILFIDWEEDILRGRSKPNQTVLENVGGFIKQSALEIEIERHSEWARKQARPQQTDEGLKNDVKFQIACEVNEGEFLSDSKTSPFGGEFILIPLEVAERYDFFIVFAKDFKRRIVAVLSTYPWRLKV